MQADTAAEDNIIYLDPRPVSGDRFHDKLDRLRLRHPGVTEKALERRAALELSREESAAMTPAPTPAAKPAEPALTPDLPTIDPSAWAGQPVPPRAWWLPALIPSRQVTLLTGDGGTGKSLLALQLAVASALGVATVGLRPIEGKALYFAAEDDEDELHRRTVDVVTALGGDVADLAGRLQLAPLADKDATLVAPDTRGRMVSTPLYEALARKVGQFKPQLLVLDTAADLFAGDEIKRNQVRSFIAALRQIAIVADCAVLLLAHPSVSGMQSGTGTSGSTGWSNSVRSRLYLTRPKDEAADPNVRELEVMKANYGAVGERVRFRWEAGAFVADSPLEPAALGMVHQRHDAQFVTLLSDINRTGARVASTKGVNYAPAAMEGHPQAGGMTKKQFEAAMQRLLAEGTIKVIWEGPPSKPRQRLIVSAEDFGPGRGAGADAAD